MKLTIDNIGIIQKSDIEINGITVITGYNNSGKTTVGKVLYSLLSAVEDLPAAAMEDKKKYVLECIENIILMLQWLLVGGGNSQNEHTIDNIIGEITESSRIIRTAISEQQLSDGLQDIVNKLDLLDTELVQNEKSPKEQVNRTIEKLKKQLIEVKKVINLDKDLVEYSIAKIENTLNQEFNHQILPVGVDTDGVIKLFKDNQIIFDVLVKENGVVHNKETCTSYDVPKVIFVDNLFVLDNLVNQIGENKIRTKYPLLLSQMSKKNFMDSIEGKTHNDKLLKELLHREDNLIKSIVNKENANLIFERLNSAFDDEIIIEKEGVTCANSKIDIRNLAMGAKLFAILKTLLENGAIKENMVLVLDEPEVHLHPEWQNILAEILILMNYQLGVTIVLTTHSSQFLMAIEYYSKKYHLKDIFNVYATNHIQNDKFVYYENITDKLKDAYYRMAKPMFDMKMKMDILEE